MDVLILSLQYVVVLYYICMLKLLWLLITNAI
jgi:hypothetical protein